MQKLAKERTHNDAVRSILEAVDKPQMSPEEEVREDLELSGLNGDCCSDGGSAAVMKPKAAALTRSKAYDYFSRHEKTIGGYRGADTAEKGAEQNHGSEEKE